MQDRVPTQVASEDSFTQFLSYVWSKVLYMYVYVQKLDMNERTEEVA